MRALLILTGSMGAGKSTVLAEASDILALRAIAHAAIDVDALALAYVSGAPRNDDLMYRNLRSVCDNYASLGVTRFLMARALESPAELDICRAFVSAANSVVCRLTANIATMEQRVRTRESGLLREQYVARVSELNAILDRARLEDFSLSTEDRPITEVAREILLRASWISSDCSSQGT